MAYSELQVAPPGPGHGQGCSNQPQPTPLSFLLAPSALLASGEWFPEFATLMPLIPDSLILFRQIVFAGAASWLGGQTLLAFLPGKSLRPWSSPQPLTPQLCHQVETISDSDTENRSRREFHSIGVQVEEDKR